MRFTLLFLAACGSGSIVPEAPDTGMPDAQPVMYADASPTDAAAASDDAVMPMFCDGGLGWCNGACVSFASDPKNCGGCGGDCKGAKCFAGQCQTHEILATNQNGARGIAVDGTSIYWATQTDGTIMKMALGGGNPTPLATNQSPYGIAVDASFVYWTSGQNVMRVGIGGGSPSVVTTDASVASSIAVDASFVYWTGANKVMKAPKTGGAAALVANASYAENLRVRDGFVYFISDPIAAVQSNRVSVNGGNPTILGTSQGSFATGIALDSASIYWADGDYVTKAPLGGGNPTTITSAFGVWQVATDGTNVYWSAGTVVKKRPVGGGAESLVATCLGECPSGFAIDSTHLYWTSYGAAAIVRAPK